MYTFYRTKILFLLLFLGSSSQSFAQSSSKPIHEKYKWEENPVLEQLTEDEAKEPAVVMLDTRINELTVADVQPYFYITRHKITRLNSDAAINKMNKVFIPLRSESEVVNIKARFISKSGKVTEIEESAIRYVENYENYGSCRLFAFEGVEIGGQIEYLYTLKTGFNIFNTEYYGGEYPYRKINLEIISPEHLKFDAKGYNGIGTPESTDDYDNKRCLRLEASNIQSHDGEKYAPDDAVEPRVEYKWAYNMSNKSNRLYTWQAGGERFHSVVYELSSKDHRKAKSLYRRINDNKMWPTEKRIRYIEHWVKERFEISKDAPEKYSSVANIVKGQLATELGMTRLMAELYAIAGIEVTLVISSERYKKVFDEEFDSWTYLQNFIFYFPETKGYLAPSEKFYRYNFLPWDWGCQKGLFITKKYSGTLNSDIKSIGCSDWKLNSNTINSNFKFNLEEGEAELHFNQNYTGYLAYFIQPFYAIIDQQRRDEAVAELFKTAGGDAKPMNIKISGYRGMDTLFYQPFSVTADFRTTKYIEKAGSSYIFKIGEAIGPQTEMYEEKNRISYMDVGYAHSLDRVIRFTVPDGYKVTNLDVLNIDVFHEDKGERTMQFKSKYEVKGNEVVVTINEDYRRVIYEKELYEPFRKVINASADFNKIVVYFEKI